MSATNLASIVSPKSARLDEIKPWVESLAKGGYFTQDYARRCANAVDAVTSILQPDESRLVEDCLANASTLVDRWSAATNNANPGMVRTIRSRFKNILEDYLDYLWDRTSFKPRVAKAKVSGEKKPKRSSSPNAEDESSQGELLLKGSKSEIVQPRTESSPGTSRLFPTRAGENFEFKLPESGISVQDAAKLFCHLLTLSRDWNPLDPSQSKILSLFRAEPAATPMITVEEK